MKKLFWFSVGFWLIFSFGFAFAFGGPGIANAQVWHVTNQATVAWDAVTTMNGNPIPAADSISYNVYIKLSDGTSIEHVGSTNQLTNTITFSVEGRYFIGVQTVRVPDGQTEQILSDISWSDIAEVCLDGITFGVRFFIPADQVKGMRLQ